MITKAKQQIQNMTSSSNDTVRDMANTLLSPHSSMEDKLIAWHKSMNIAMPAAPQPISIPDMERRLRLTLEEYLETVNAGGFTIVSKTTGLSIIDDLKLVPVEGAVQDLKEIADGLADILVVTLGHATEHGIPINAVFNEVMYSNGTKLPEDGIPIKNKCVLDILEHPSHACDPNNKDCELIDPTAPVGKVLKPKSYIKCDINAILYPEFTTAFV